ncbi:MAG: dihydroneopterin aldolase [Gammaproteobacteria bacterium]
MDKVFIKDLRAQTIIGIFDWEREVRQEIKMDFEFDFCCLKAAKSDNIQDALDYKKITKKVITFVENSKFKLIEALGENVIKLIKKDFPDLKITLTISKPGALRGAQDVGIILTR